MKYKSVIFLLILSLQIAPLQNCFSYRSFNTRTLSFYYGSTYRFDKTYRHSISIDNWILKGGCTYSKYYGFGISYEFENRNNYNLGVRYFRSPQKHPAFYGLMLYFGIAPTTFNDNNHWGVNVAPEIGLHIPFFDNKVGAGLNLFYGYDIQLINEKAYSIDRNRLTLKISFDIDSKLFSRKNDPKKDVNEIYNIN